MSSLPIFLFRAVGRALVFDGFLRVWQEADEKGDDEDEPQQLPALTAGELLDLLKLIPRQHFTQPPPRYTEAALIKALEERGIGRPSTYAAIMATLKAREYVVPEKRQLRPTPLGEFTCDALIAAFPGMMDYGFTAQVEDWLDDVSRGENDWVKTLRDFYTPFAQSLLEAEAKMRAVPRPAEPVREPGAPDEDATGEGGEAPSGAGPRYRKSGKKGRGGGKWRGKKPTGTGKPAPVQTDAVCPKCGAPMVQRTGPRGPFLGCSRFPGCKGTRNLNEPAPSPGGAPGAG